MEKPDKTETVEKSEKTEKTVKADKAEKVENVEKVEKTEKADKAEKVERTAKSTKTPYHYGTGRRKSAVARVRLYPGSGVITVNGRPAPEYFGGRVIHQAQIQRPLQLTGTRERYDVIVKVVGGGITGQAGAVQHGISRALARSDDEFRPTLKKERLLTRDPRVKERKKVGLKRARKAPQYTKR